MTMKIVMTTIMMKSNFVRPIWRVSWAAVVLCLLAHQGMAAENKPTSLSDARAAVEANLRTAEGKKYDEQIGTEFLQKHLATLRECKPSAGGDWRSFWILLKLDRSGAPEELLLYPETKLGTCARSGLLKASFSAPPRPEYWVSVYMQISH